MLHSPSLETLKLEECECSDIHDFVDGANQSKLRTIECYQCKLADANLAAIATLPNLKWLDIYDPDPGGKGPLDYSPLQNNSSMYHLTIHDKRLVSPLWIAKCKNLTWLDLRGTRFADTDLQTITALRKLKALDIAKTAVTDTFFNAFQSTDVLKILRVGSQDLSWPAVEECITKHSLSHLTLVDMDMEQVNLSKVAASPTLKVLNVSDTSKPSKALRTVPSDNTIKLLIADGCELDDAVCARLASWRSLKEVDFNRCKLTYKQLLKVASNPTRPTISFVGSSLSEEEMRRARAEIPQLIQVAPAGKEK